MAVLQMIKFDCFAIQVSKLGYNIYVYSRSTKIPRSLERIPIVKREEPMFFILYIYVSQRYGTPIAQRGKVPLLFSVPSLCSSSVLVGVRDLYHLSFVKLLAIKITLFIFYNYI